MYNDKRSSLYWHLHLTLGNMEGITILTQIQKCPGNTETYMSGHPCYKQTPLSLTT